MARRSEMVTYALIAAAIGLGAWVIVDRDRPTTKEQAGRAGLLLRVFRQDDITRISIDRRGQKYELLREGESWKLIKAGIPRAYRTDLMSVMSLIHALAGAISEREVGKVTPSDRAQFGLDAPRAVLELAMKGVTIKIAVGGPATGSTADDAGIGSAYAEVAPYGDQKGGVYVIKPDVVAAIDRAPETYRDPSLLTGYMSTTFSRVEIKGVVALERGPYGSWRIAGSPPVRADIDAVDGIFKTFADLKADPFVPDTPAPDLAQGALVEVKSEPSSRVAIAFGGSCNGDPKLVTVQQQAPDTLTGCVSKITTDRLLRAASTYVDGHAFGLLYGTETAKISEIEYVEIVHDKTKVLEAERAGDGLHLRVPSSEQIGKEGADRYLVRLANVAGTVVSPKGATWTDAELAELGLSPPAGRVTIKRRVDPMSLGPLPTPSDGGATIWTQSVDVGKETDAKNGPRFVHLRRADDGAVLRVPLDVAAAVMPSAVYELRNPNLLQLAPESITRVTVRGARVPYTLSRIGGVFVLADPPKLGADAASAGDVTRHLASLTCSYGWRAKDDGTFGFGTPSATVELALDPKTIDAGAATMTIELGASTPEGGVFSRIKGADAVCVIGEAKRDALLRVPFDRSILAFRGDDTPVITVKRATVVRSLGWNDASKSWRDGSGAGGAADLVARKLADMIVGLRAEGVVHLGAADGDEGFATPTLTVEGLDAASKGVKRKLVIGAVGKLDKVPIYFARVEGIDATFAILRDDVDKLLQAM